MDHKKNLALELMNSEEEHIFKGIGWYLYNGDFIEKVAVTDLAIAVPFYLRGVDFTNQMLDLLGDQKIMASVNDALSVNTLMQKILNNENNTRR